MINNPISIQIIHPEQPGAFLLPGATGGYVETNQELLEVQEAIFVCVECPEDVLAEVLECFVPRKSFTTEF